MWWESPLPPVCSRAALASMAKSPGAMPNRSPSRTASATTAAAAWGPAAARPTASARSMAAQEASFEAMPTRRPNRSAQPSGSPKSSATTEHRKGFALGAVNRTLHWSPKAAGLWEGLPPSVYMSMDASLFTMRIAKQVCMWHKPDSIEDCSKHIWNGYEGLYPCIRWEGRAICAGSTCVPHYQIDTVR